MSNTILLVTISVLTLVIFLLLLILLYVIRSLIVIRKGELLDSKGQFVNKSNYYCKNHSENFADGSCMICGDMYCGKCLKSYEKLVFCREHFNFYMDNKWKILEEVHVTSDNPNAGLDLYKKKEDLWEQSIPTIVETHYKINFGHDAIESIVYLYGLD